MFLSLFLGRKWGKNSGFATYASLLFFFFFILYSMFYKQFLANTYHKTSLCHHVLLIAWSDRWNYSCSRQETSKNNNWKWTSKIYHGNRCQAFTWNEINFGKWGNSQQADLLRCGFEDCQICSNHDKKQTLLLHLLKKVKKIRALKYFLPIEYNSIKQTVECNFYMAKLFFVCSGVFHILTEVEWHFLSYLLPLSNIFFYDASNNIQAFH